MGNILFRIYLMSNAKIIVNFRIRYWLLWIMYDTTANTLWLGQNQFSFFPRFFKRMFFLWPLQHIWFSCLGSAEVLSHLPTSEVTEGLMHLCEPLVQPLSQVCITESPMSLKDYCCCTLSDKNSSDKSVEILAWCQKF